MVRMVWLLPMLLSIRIAATNQKLHSKSLIFTAVQWIICGDKILLSDLPRDHK